MDGQNQAGRESQDRGCSVLLIHQRGRLYKATTEPIPDRVSELPRRLSQIGTVPREAPTAADAFARKEDVSLAAYSPVREENLEWKPKI